MIIYGSKTGSKFGHFPKIANLFNKIGVARACSRSEKNNFLPSLVHKLS